MSPGVVEARADNTVGNLCSICNEGISKYKCPGCQAATCSLLCCKQHKQQTGCSGKRDRLAFVPMQEFSDRHLMSDYHWLEEVNRVDDNAKRHRPPIPRKELPQHLGSLVHQARLRGVRLLIMAPGMQRRQTNSTRYDPRTRKLFWRLEWRFHEAAAAAAAAPTDAAAAAGAIYAGSAAAVSPPAANEPQQQQPQQQQQQHRVVLFDGKVDEEAVLSSVLGRHLEYRQGQGAQALQLRHYREAGVEALTVLMKKERCPANAVRYYRLDTTQPLKSQLAGKLVIEYPTLTVLLPGDESSYDVITQEELQAEEQARQAYRQQQQQQRQHHWPPPPPPPPPRVPKPDEQQQQQQTEQPSQQEEQQQPQEAGMVVGSAAAPAADPQEPPAKRQCTGSTPGGSTAPPGPGGQAGEQGSSVPQQQQQQGQVQQQEQEQEQGGKQLPRYYYYDPTAGADEDAADCLAGLMDDDDLDAGGTAADAAAAEAGCQQQVQAGDVCAAGGGSSVLMQLLGQYHDENEIDISDEEA